MPPAPSDRPPSTRSPGLLDELHLFVNPTAIGAGIPVFPRDACQHLRLVASTPFECGITALHLVPARPASRLGA